MDEEEKGSLIGRFRMKKSTKSLYLKCKTGMQKNSKDSSEGKHGTNEDAPLPPRPPVFQRAIPIKDVQSVKRLIARLVRGLQYGPITESRSKTLTYMLSVYCQIHNGVEFAERLAELERKSNLDEQNGDS
jgi:hypothetical protein